MFLFHQVLRQWTLTHPFLPLDQDFDFLLLLNFFWWSILKSFGSIPVVSVRSSHPQLLKKKSSSFFLLLFEWHILIQRDFFFFKISSVRLLLHMFVESTQWSHGAAETMEMLRAATVSFRCLIKIYCMMENCWLSLKIRGFCFTVVKDKNGSVVI